MNNSVEKASEASEFDSAIDNILELFEEGGCWDNNDNNKLSRAHENYNRLTAEQKFVVACKNPSRNIPRVMKNDIRRYFSRMLMNTVNSGDMGLVQDYFNTFMTGPSKFVVDYYNIDPIFQLPNSLNAHGPQMMSHYLLGCFVMYPDIVIQMSDTRIITSSNWAGSKVEMDVIVLATKMYDLAMDDWIPQLATLQSKCQSLVTEKKKKKKPSIPVAETTVTHTTTAVITPSFALDGLICLSGDSTDEESSSNSESGSPTDCDQPTMTMSPEAIANKRKACELICAGTGQLDSNNSDSQDSVAFTTTANQSVDPTELRIPDDYVYALASQAQLLPVPVQIRMSGKFTWFLDESNRIQHINLSYTQSY